MKSKSLKKEVVVSNASTVQKNERQAFTITVTDKGVPCKDTLVQVYIPKSDVIKSSRTNAKGQALFYGLLKNGKYTISVRGNGKYVKAVEMTFKGFDYDFDWEGFIQQSNTASIIFIAKDSMTLSDFEGLDIASNVGTNYITANIHNKRTNNVGQCTFDFDVPSGGPVLSVTLTYTNPINNVLATYSFTLNAGDCITQTILL